MFFCLKTSKHTKNATSANYAVIPGKDYGSNHTPSWMKQ